MYPVDGMKFRAILADPPWDYASPGRGASNTDSWFGNKRTLTIADLCSATIPSWGNCLLFLWSPPTVVQTAISVMNHWGFRYKTCLIWGKITKAGQPWMGMGHFLRNSHELLLIGEVGSSKANNRSTRSLFLTPPLGNHAEKPDEVYNIIEGLVSGPYLELFARKRRPGWFAYGDEVEGGSDISIPEWKTK